MRLLFYFLFLIPSALPAQHILRGKVVDELTNKPVSGASIYFNNTSIGTSSNNAGEFSISQPGIANADLVISSVGFQSLLYKIDGTEFTGRPYIFQLKTKESTMENVLVLTDLTRGKYLQIFTENFLGITEEAAASRILNKDAIVFTSSPAEPGVLMAFTDTPLVIVNKMLGYTIHFQLEMFMYDKQTSSTSFYGFTRYEEMGSKPKWIKNRHKAYYGSTLHFFRSLISNRLEQEMYKVFVVKEVQLRSDTGIQKVETAYPVSANFLIKADSLQNSYQATWDHKLMIQYMKNPSSKAFLSHATFLQGNIPTGFRSWLTLKTPSIQIDASGILQDPLSVMYSGYWIYEKAANLLPFNYQP
jgi:hypothetical protein